MKKKNIGAVIGLLCTAMWMSFAVIDLAEARIGGGRSSGSRGSHSTSAPRQTFSPPPSRPQTAPPPSMVTPGQQPRPGMATPAQQPSGFGGFGRGLAGGLAGGLVGGMIGNMLFGGSGHAGPGGAPAAGGGCTSIGLFDLIIVGGLLYLGYRMLTRRRQEEAYQASDLGGTATTIPATWQPAEPIPAPMPEYNVKAALDPIQRTDSSFNETAFKETAQDVFFKLQGAWMRQDPSLIKDLATPELAAILEKDLQDLKTKGQINRLENIAVRQVEVSEAWQEQGQDYITVGFLANLLDYTVDANTNLVLAGSDKDPVKFEEYWTFTRPTGSGAWKLSAINQPEG
jgi:predicted lipid-binding transport protein (Tim44 family)